LNASDFFSSDDSRNMINLSFYFHLLARIFIITIFLPVNFGKNKQKNVVISHINLYVIMFEERDLIHFFTWNYIDGAQMAKMPGNS
jgi:protein-S-isoprenylcysteine O-methyltransferase Ste14